MPIKCYVDASYSKEKSTSVIAYIIGDEPIKTIIYKDIKNTQAELNGVLFCIDYCIENYSNEEIIIYTDCQNAFKQDYSNKSINLKLIKIKGHKPSREANEDDKIFKMVDKYARKILRSL
jgi:ribonuclease HI